MKKFEDGSVVVDEIFPSGAATTLLQAVARQLELRDVVAVVVIDRVGVEPRKPSASR